MRRHVARRLLVVLAVAAASGLLLSFASAGADASGTTNGCTVKSGDTNLTCQFNAIGTSVDYRLAAPTDGSGFAQINVFRSSSTCTGPSAFVLDTSGHQHATINPVSPGDCIELSVGNLKSSATAKG
jgi:hypothetical protein